MHLASLRSSYKSAQNTFPMIASHSEGPKKRPPGPSHVSKVAYLPVFVTIASYAFINICINTKLT